eukprot:g2720.t1
MATTQITREIKANSSEAPTSVLAWVQGNEDLVRQAISARNVSFKMFLPRANSLYNLLKVHRTDSIDIPATVTDANALITGLENTDATNVSCLENFPSDCNVNQTVDKLDQIVERVNRISNLLLEIHDLELERLTLMQDMYDDAVRFAEDVVARRRSEFTAENSTSGGENSLLLPLQVRFLKRNYYYGAEAYRSNEGVNGETRNEAETGDGGAIQSIRSTITISDDTKSYNSKAPFGKGGAIALSSSSLHLHDALVEKSAAVAGGAIAAKLSIVNLRESIIRSNQAYTDGGGLYLGEGTDTVLDSTELCDNAIKCPVRMEGVSVTISENGQALTQDCPEWDNAVVKGSCLDYDQGTTGICWFCIHPSCINYLGGGGAAFAESSLRLKVQDSVIRRNTATGGGGCIFAKDTINIDIQSSSFTECKTANAMDLGGDPPFTPGGGALYLTLSRFYRIDSGKQPVITNTIFHDNSVQKGSGGAIFWSVPPSMFSQVNDMGGLISLIGYDQSSPLAVRNSAEWGSAGGGNQQDQCGQKPEAERDCAGNFIASGPFKLVVVEGYADEEGQQQPSTYSQCEGLGTTGVCPFKCSGFSSNGQQCAAFQSVASSVEVTVAPGGRAISAGGDALSSDKNLPDLRVAVLDFYNHIFETAMDPILVESRVNTTAHGLGLSYDEDSRDVTNCTQVASEKYPDECMYKLSPGISETSMVVTAVPEKGIATFKGLMIHARPSDRCYVSSAGDDTICTPSKYGLKITSPSLLGLDVTAEPKTAIRVADCQPGTWLDTTPGVLACKGCPPGKYSPDINTNLDGRQQEDPCIYCNVGQYQHESGQDHCDNCPQGRYAQLRGASRCEICRNGTHTGNATGNSECIGCDAGTYGYVDPSLEGEDYDAATCRRCPEGRFQALAFDEFQNMISGSEELVTKSIWDCDSCPFGYMAKSVDTKGCQYCPAGKVSEEGQMKCTIDCPAGFYREETIFNYNDLGNLTYRAWVDIVKPHPTELCFMCPAGYSSAGEVDATKDELNPFRNNCTKCAPGRHQNNPGGKYCIDCEAGKNASTSGQVSCETCTPGKYQDESGQRTCKDCEYGLHNPSEAVEHFYFFQQDANLLLSNPQEKMSDAEYDEAERLARLTQSNYPPKQCRKGSERRCNEKGFTWDIVADGRIPSLQNLRERIDGYEMVSRTDGSKFTVTLLLTDPDVENAYPEFPTMCQTCTPGKWTVDPKVVADGGIGRDSCFNCPAGKFGETLRHGDRTHHRKYAECVECPLNTYLSGEGHVECMTCPAGSWTRLSTQSTACIPCEMGETFTGILPRNCEKCPGIKNSSIGERGFYSFQRGSDACLECSPGKVCHGGSDVSTEWGWWTSSGLDSDTALLRKKMSKAGKLPENFELCDQLYSNDVDTAAEIALRGNASRDNSELLLAPLQCGDTCEENVDPGCVCTEEKRLDSKDVKQCKIECDAGVDKLRHGIYADACGLPRKVARCDGFQMRVSCDDEFRRQMLELINGRRSSISIEAQCSACRSNTIIYRTRERLKVTVNISALGKRTASATFNDHKILVDALWLYEAGLQETPWSLHKYLEDKSDMWDLELIVYRMPRAGIWDEEAYNSSVTDMISSLLSNGTVHKNGNMSVLVVALPANDPRLYHLDMAEKLSQAAAERETDALTANTDWWYTNASFSSFSRLDCNVMAGYTGRMCQTCIEGFSMKDGKCLRCPPHLQTVGIFVFGFICGFFIVKLMVIAVVSDAGSTSTSSALKKIVLNHLQLLSLITAFDMNWNTDTKALFALSGAISSIGEQLIQTDCLFGAYGKKLPIRLVYFKQLLFCLLLIAFMILTGLYWILRVNGVKGLCCISAAHDKVPRRRLSQVAKNNAALKQKKTLKKSVNDPKVRALIASASQFQRSGPPPLKSRLRNALGQAVTNINMGDLGSVAIQAERREVSKAAELYQMQTLALKNAGVVDMEGQSKFVANRNSRARLLARSFVREVALRDMNLIDIFREYDPTDSGEIKIEDFISILRGMKLGWSEDDYDAVAQLFDGVDGDGQVELSRITRFGKTAMDSIILTWLILVEVMYPTIVRACFKLIACRSDLDDGESMIYLRADLSVSCTSAEHVSMLILFVMPVTICFIIGAPILSNLALRRSLRIHGFGDDTTNYRYAVLLGGYDRKSWYWAQVINLRKLFLSLAVAASALGTQGQYLFGLATIIIALACQLHYQPFTNKELNFMENLGLGILFVSMYLGLLFFWESFSNDGLFPNDERAHDDIQDCLQCDGEVDENSVSCKNVTCEEGLYYTGEKCKACETCAAGKSGYKDDGTLSCGGSHGTECVACPEGKYQQINGAKYTTPCKDCNKGKISNPTRSGCVFLDYKKLCKRQANTFPNADRTECMEVHDVKLDRSEYSSHETLHTTLSWNLSHVDEDDVEATLCELDFKVLHVHSRCESREKAPTVFNGIKTWSSCAKSCRLAGHNRCNFNRQKERCEIADGCENIDFNAVGWYVLDVSEWDCKSPGSLLGSKLETRARTEIFDVGSFCFPDDSYIRGRVGLKVQDKGFTVNGQMTNLDLLDRVYALSSGFAKGDADGGMSAESVKFRTIGVQRGSAAVQSRMGGGIANTSAADLRVSDLLIDFLVEHLYDVDRGIEPINAVMWPGDLKFLASAKFPSSVRRNPSRLRKFVAQCLEDQASISEKGIRDLAALAWDETSPSWRSFGISSDEGGSIRGFPRVGKQIFRVGIDKFRCQVELTDGCENGGVVHGTHEVTVQGFRLQSFSEGDQFLANVSKSVDVVGAGFLKARSDYECIWAQPTLEDPTFLERIPGTAASFGRVTCSTPSQWKGLAGPIQLALSGPILEYRGCYNVHTIVARANQEASRLGKNYRYSLKDSGAHVPAMGHTGLANCQLRVSKFSDSTDIIALMDENKVETFAIEAQSVSMWAGCTYIGVEDYTDNLDMRDARKVINSVVAAMSGLPDTHCDSICTTQISIANGLGSPTEEERVASAFDVAQPQQCGSVDMMLASVYSSEQHEGYYVGAYEILPSRPSEPRWGARKDAVSAMHGRVELSWMAPEFLGGGRVHVYEIKFYASIHGSEGTTTVRGNIHYPSWHGEMCEVTGRSKEQLFHPSRATFFQSEEDSSIKAYYACPASAPRCVTGVNESSCTGLSVGSQTSFTLTNLDPRLEYNITVRARTEHGWSEPSEQLVVQPKAVTVPERVRHLRIDADTIVDGIVKRGITESSLHLVWNRPMDDGGSSIASYEVQIARINCGATSRARVLNIDAKGRNNENSSNTYLRIIAGEDGPAEYGLKDFSIVYDRSATAQKSAWLTDARSIRAETSKALSTATAGGTHGKLRVANWRSSMSDEGLGDDWSVSVWAYLQAYAQTGESHSIFFSDSNSSDFFFAVDVNGLLGFGKGTDRFWATNRAVELTQWVHIEFACVKGAKLHAFVDGEEANFELGQSFSCRWEKHDADLDIFGSPRYGINGALNTSKTHPYRPLGDFDDIRVEIGTGRSVTSFKVARVPPVLAYSQEPDIEQKLVIEDLEEGAEYAVNVRAINSMGLRSGSNDATWKLENVTSAILVEGALDKVNEQGDSTNCSTTSSMVVCPAFDPDGIGDRGMYSFVAGASACQSCPPGRLCHGGTKMTTEWGWWVSEGLDDHKKDVAEKIKEREKSGEIHLNAEKCGGSIDSIQKNTTIFDRYDPLQCRSVCEEKKDPGCVCTTTECTIQCEGDFLDKLRGGLFLDECAVPRKVTRCPRFQSLVSCEDNFRRQIQEVRDKNHPRLQVSIEPQCMACRENNIVSVERHDNVKVIRKSTGLLEDHVTCEVNENETLPVDVLWLFNDVSVESNVRYKIPKGDTWNISVVTYKMTRSGAWDESEYATFQPEEYEQEKDEIRVALLEGDPRLKEIEEGGSNVHKCNIMSGHSGRLCRTCLPGFGGGMDGCKRCNKHGFNVANIVIGFLVAFAIVMVAVVAVTNDA